MSDPGRRTCPQTPARPLPSPLTPSRRRWQIALAAWALGLPALPALAAPATPAAATTPGRLETERAIRATYLCRGRFDALELTALFFNGHPSELVLLEGETATRLPQLPAASGARYGGGGMEFWIKGETAIWRLGPDPAAVMPCTTRGAQSQR